MAKDNDNYRKKKQFDLIDFYEVLGIEDMDLSTSEIRKKYIKLAVKYHPDKSVDADPQIFALIQRAWECLGNDEKRKQYDFFLKNEQKAKKSDHNNLKKNFDDFMELKTNVSEDENVKKKAEIDFQNSFEEMDKKRKFDRKKFKESALSAKETNNRFNDLMLEREQQEIEFAQNRIFPEGTKFSGDSLKVFNKIFIDYKKKTDKKNNIIKKAQGPTAFNSIFDDQNFTSLDSFDKTFDEDNNSTTCGLNYGDLNEFGNEVKLEVDYDNIKNIDTSDLDFNIDIKEDNYMENIEKKLREREFETDNLNNNKFDDFATTQDTSYMFTHEIGNVGSIEWGEDDNDELVEACDRLIELENRK